MDKKELENLTEDWVREILADIATEDHDLMGDKNISEILNRTVENLKKTSFSYLGEEEANKVFGEEMKGYLKSKGLPCVDIPGSSGVKFMKQILNSQFKMRDDFLSGFKKPNLMYLSDYVYYSMAAHFLAKMV